MWALGGGWPIAVHLTDGFTARALGVAAGVAVWLLLASRWWGARWASVYLAATAAALVLASPTGAHRTSAVAAASSIVALRALRGPARDRFDPDSPPSILAVPVIATAGLLWFRTSEVLAVLLLLAIGWIVVLQSERRPAGARQVVDAAGSLARTLGTAISILVVTPVAGLAFLIGTVSRLLARRRQRRATTSWTARRTTAADERRFGTLPFAPETARVRWSRHAVVAIAVLGLVVVARSPELGRGPDTVAARPPVDAASAPSSSIPATEDEEFENRASTRFSDLPAYRGVPFADELQDEQQRLTSALPSDPVTGFGSGTFRGRHTNVSDGVRRTWSGCEGCPVVDLWMTGGSSAFGLGQRDEYTIASYLARFAAEEGIDLRVVNLAVPGWTSAQERAALEARLAGEQVPVPDLIVVYGGYNDALASLIDAALGDADPDRPAVLDGDRVAALVERRVEERPAGYVERAIDVAIERYDRELRQIEQLALDGDARLLVYFQPDALASAAQLRPVADVYRGLPPESIGPAAEVLRGTAEGLEGQVTSLRDLFDSLDRSVFVDWAHTNELGAEVVARAIFADLAPELRARAADGD